MKSLWLWLPSRFSPSVLASDTQVHSATSFAGLPRCRHNLEYMASSLHSPSINLSRFCPVGWVLRVGRPVSLTAVATRVTQGLFVESSAVLHCLALAHCMYR
jgi:hypothetical protein